MKAVIFIILLLVFTAAIGFLISFVGGHIFLAMGFKLSFPSFFLGTIETIINVIIGLTVGLLVGSSDDE
jgi:hypothetical protein